MNAQEPLDVHRLFNQHFAAGDLDALVRLYEPDALLVVDGAPARGLYAIREALGGFLASGATLDWTTRVAHVVGDVAFLSADHTITVAGHTAKGASAEVMRRQADGRWLYVIDHPGFRDQHHSPSMTGAPA